ncbi:MAG TPA: hypothetical protein VFS20_28905 [Longimicrobium sp.]|nr:hypothetical protein [Longimicrobium sp.]
MSVRPWIGIAAAFSLLAAAACDASGLFSSTAPFGGGGIVTGSGTVQGSVLSGGSGLGGVPVVLIGRDSTQTASNGVFAFDSLPAATYQLAVRVPIGYALAAGQTATRSVSVSSGATTGITFVLQQTTTVP